MSLIPRARWARFGQALTIILAVVLFYMLFSAWQGNVQESAWLIDYMNADFPSSHTIAVKSSFDWSSVKHKYLTKKPKPLPTAKTRLLPRIQHDHARPTTSRLRIQQQERRKHVRDLFRKNWDSYRRYAWKKDALQPISGTYKDQFSGWAATLVDSLDSLWIMGLRKEFDEAVDAVASIDFGNSSSTRVNTFETTIRYLGGLLSAYDLSERPVLLQKATELGDFLLGAFNTPNNMPCDFIDFEGAKSGAGLRVETAVVSAAPGTLTMELTHLSQLTGDPKYYSAADRVMTLFGRGQMETDLPGLWPFMVSMSTKNVIQGKKFTLGGGADSLYEYLPKMVALLGGLDDKYEHMARSFLETAEEALLFRPMLPKGEDILISGEVNIGDDAVSRLNPTSEHLTCFVGGLYALSGKLFNRPGWVNTGSKLARGCIYAYHSTPTGMMPEFFKMLPCESKSICPWDEKLWDTGRKNDPEHEDHVPKGFTSARDPRYILRPEAIESVFVLWRITGREEFQEAAWDMFEAISNGTGTEYGNAAVRNVMSTKLPLEQDDYMESFWLAETLKYFYLVFSPPDLINLDEWVLNTEAHPFRRPK